MTSPEEVIARQFAAHFNGNELHGFIDEDLARRGSELGENLLRILGPRAAEAAALLRAMAADRRHPAFERIEVLSLVGWNLEPELRGKFATLAAAATGRIDAALDDGPFRQAAEAHRRWLLSEGADGTRLDVHAARLVGANLAGACLRDARLHTGELVDVDLDGADLRDAYLLENVWVRVSAAGIDAKRADLFRLYASDVSFADANLDRADFAKAQLHGVDLSRASLREARLLRVLPTGTTSFAGADLTRADLTGALLVEVDLRGANVDRADLTRADLTGAKIDGITGTPARTRDLRCEWVELGGERVGREALFRALGLPIQAEPGIQPVIDYSVGEVRLRIDLVGAARLDHRTLGAWTGKLAEAPIKRLLDALVRARWDDVPPTPAGRPGVRKLTVDWGPEQDHVVIEEPAGRTLDGFREAFAILDSLAVQMSGHAYRGAPDTIEPAVTDLRRVTRL